MRRIGWAVVHALLEALDPDEKDAVLGDLLELRTPVGRAVFDVAGLVARRQARRLAGWPPVLALCGAAIPLAMLVALLSRVYAEGTAIRAFMLIENWSPAFLASPGGRHDLAAVVVAELLGFATLCAWSWTMGFSIGSLSRGTAWISGAAFAVVLVGEFVLVPQSHHPGNAAAFESMTYSVVLPLFIRTCFVLGPVAWGLRHGAGRGTIGRPLAIALALVTAGLTAMAAGRMAIAARGGWWRLDAEWELRVFQAAVWLPIAFVLGKTLWPRRAPDRHDLVPGTGV